MKIPIIFFIIISLISCGQQENKPEQLNDGIETGTLKEAGLDARLINAMIDSIRNGNYTNVHSVLIFRKKKLVYEEYFPGNDEVRMKGSVGFVDHHRDSLHDIRSISKSVVSAMTMIAIDQGKLSMEQRVFDFFPEFSAMDTGLKRQIKVSHLLNMSSGLYWKENSYNDSLKKGSKKDVINFILQQKVMSAPGTTFEYNSSSTQLLAFILEKATGTDPVTFANEYLFQPLGIKNYEWTIEENGLMSAWAGLRMRSRDLLKLGMLYLNDGKWNGKQLIPAELISASIKKQITTPYGDSTFHVNYGYQFWIYSETLAGRPVTYAQAQGNGGQIIVIDKQNDMVVVLTSGNYYQDEQMRKSSWNIPIDFVYPAIIKKY